MEKGGGDTLPAQRAVEGGTEMGEGGSGLGEWLKPEEFALHSGRIGGATRLAAMGGESTGHPARRQVGVELVHGVR